jgi:hypothetical protein
MEITPLHFGDVTVRIHPLRPVRVFLAHDEQPWVPVYS